MAHNNSKFLQNRMLLWCPLGQPEHFILKKKSISQDDMNGWRYECAHCAPSFLSVFSIHFWVLWHTEWIFRLTKWKMLNHVNVEISILSVTSETGMRRCKSAWLTFKACWAWAPPQPFVQGCIRKEYEHDRALIFLNSGTWNATRRKIRRREPNN